MNFIMFNFFLFIYYYGIDFLALKYGYIVGDFMVDFNFMLLNTIISMLLSIFTLIKFQNIFD